MNKSKGQQVSSNIEQVLTRGELIEKASVYENLNSALINEEHRIEEREAARTASALRLELCKKGNFIFMAISESEEHLLELSKAFPVEMLNCLPVLLRSVGMYAEKIEKAHILDNFLKIKLASAELLVINLNM